MIAQIFKKVLSKIILSKQFGFLQNRQIHEAIRVSQEGMHSIKLKKSKGAILKIDISKDFDRVSCLYLRLLLTHLGFNYAFMKWIFECISIASFFVLINGLASPFFLSERGLRQWFWLSLLLFLLVAEGLSMAILDAKRRGIFDGI